MGKRERDEAERQRRAKSYREIEEMGVARGPSAAQLRQHERDLERIRQRTAQKGGKS